MDAIIFDPIGVAAPFIVRIKRLLQEIWERGINWDQELPNDPQGERVGVMFGN